MQTLPCAHILRPMILGIWVTGVLNWYQVANMKEFDIFDVIILSKVVPKVASTLLTVLFQKVA